MLVKILKISAEVLIILLLTIISQVGGIIYLLTLLIVKKGGTLEKYGKAASKLYFVLLFCFLYFLSSVFLIPKIALAFGSSPLPIDHKSRIVPHNALTWILNRHYVRNEVLVMLHEIADEIAKEEEKVTYFDANFPFMDGFPLLPHYSHNDGKKIDFSFQYKDAMTNQTIVGNPSWLGYGYCEEPKANEVNMPEQCLKKGYWYYDFLKKYAGTNQNAGYIFDENKTKRVVEEFANHKQVSKIFIEPHLRHRLHLQGKKIRVHGCHAVRHDDHFHVEFY